MNGNGGLCRYELSVELSDKCAVLANEEIWLELQCVITKRTLITGPSFRCIHVVPRFMDQAWISLQ